MSIRAMVWAFEQQCPSPAAKLVLIKLADHADDEGRCWPSQSRIASDCGLTRQWVNAQVKALAKLGLIECKQAIDEHGQHANRYFLRCQQNGHPVSTQATPPVNSVDTEPTSEPSWKERDAIASPKKGPANGAGARGSRLAATWRPCGEDREFAEGLGLDADAIGDQFRDYWIGKSGSGATKLDWCATWRNWCRRAAEGNGAKRNGQGDSVTIAAIRRLNF